jgi:hypothetical protein
MTHRSARISDELARLLAQQTEFFKKRSHTSEEIMAYEQSRDRVRELFAELEQSKVA